MKYLTSGFASFLALIVAASAAGQTVSPPRLAGIYGGGTVELGEAVLLQPKYDSGFGPAGLQFQWRKNGADLAGKTAADLEIEAVVAGDAGTYSLAASNSAGTSVVSTELTVKPGAAPAIKSQPRAAAVDVGSAGAFSVVVTGSYPRTYQWRKDGSNLPGATDSGYWISAASVADAGAYSVQVTNSFGSVVSTAAALTVNAARPPTVAAFPDNTLTWTEGNSASLSAPAAAGSSPFTYQWRKDGRLLAGNTGSTLYLDSVVMADRGRYSVVVSNIAGSATSNELAIEVQPGTLPGLLRTTTVQVVAEGDPATLGNTTAVAPGVLYQWHKDGQPVPGATRPSLDISKASPDSAGSYFLRAWNMIGGSSSNTIELWIAPRASTQPWFGSERFGDIVYFAFTKPARIERFDLSTNAWLSPLTLSGTPTAFAVGAPGLFVAYGGTVYRMGLGGDNPAAVTAAFPFEVAALNVAGSLLLVANDAGGVSRVRLSDGTNLGGLGTPVYAPLQYAPGLGTVYGVDGNSSPRYVEAVTLTTAGQVTGDTSRIAQISGLGQGLYLSPDEQFIVSGGGVVIDTASMAFAAGLGGRVDDLAFTGAHTAVALRGATVSVYDASFAETGRFRLDSVGARIYVRGDQAFVFSPPADDGRIRSTRVPLGQARSLPSAMVVDPTRVGYTPDTVMLDRNGVVLLFSKEQRNVFRWSPATRQYLASLPVAGYPNGVTYSSAHDAVFLVYGDGRITRLADEAGAVERPFATAGWQAVGLAAVDDAIVAAALPDYLLQYEFYLCGTAALPRIRPAGLSREYVWNAQARRLYYFREDVSSNTMACTSIAADGTFSGSVGVPSATPFQARYPIRVSASGATVVLGSGKLFDGKTLALTDSLPHSVDDAEWAGEQLFTARAVAAGCLIERWSTRYALERSVTVPGRISRLLSLGGDRLLAVSVIDGQVSFTILNEELEIQAIDRPSVVNRIANLSARASVGRGDQVLIPGFVIAGKDPKTVLIRAVGPTLGSFGVKGTLFDPGLTVYDSTGTSIAMNDNWSTWGGGALTDSAVMGWAVRNVGAFRLPNGSADAATVLTLTPGAYTVQVKGSGVGEGVSLVEVYDMQDNSGGSRLVNIATRALVKTGEQLLIGGVVVQGPTRKTLLIRAVGPTLAGLGVSGTLADPTLRVFSGTNVVAANDDWSDGGLEETSRIATTAAKLGAFSLQNGSHDAALLMSADAGAYSIEVSGKDGTTGVALVEVYEVP